MISVMARYNLEKGCVSKRSIELAYGFNSRHLSSLIFNGVLVVRGYGVLEASLSNLVEGEHYVVCLQCNRRQAVITDRHLKWCSGTSVASYISKHPNGSTSSSVTTTKKAKSPAQRQTQSAKLKARFQTPEGEVTKQQISAAAIRMQASDYGQVAADHLRSLQTPERRIAQSAEVKARWQDPEYRAKCQGWHLKNRDESLRLAAQARRSIGRKRTKPHLQLKEALVASGLGEFETEYEVGYYAIDEGLARLKIAVEMDGCYWHGCDQCGFPGIGKIHTYDKRKTAYLVNRGWSILRLPEHEVKADLTACVKKVVDLITRLEGTHDQSKL